MRRDGRPGRGHCLDRQVMVIAQKWSVHDMQEQDGDDALGLISWETRFISKRKMHGMVCPNQNLERGRSHRLYSPSRLFCPLRPFANQRLSFPFHHLVPSRHLTPNQLFQRHRLLLVR